MNISFQISKVDTKYLLKFLLFDRKFIEFLERKNIIQILFNDKKIKKPDYTSWFDCSISNDKFSFYVSDTWRTNIKGHNTHIIKEDDLSQTSNKYILIHFNTGYDQTIESDIEDFDKIFIKAMKVLSDTYNKYQKLTCE